jgi:hypothetical protein
MPPHVFPNEYLFSGCFGELLPLTTRLAFLLAMGGIGSWVGPAYVLASSKLSFQKTVFSGLRDSFSPADLKP